MNGVLILSHQSGDYFMIPEEQIIQIEYRHSNGESKTYVLTKSHEYWSFMGDFRQDLMLVLQGSVITILRDRFWLDDTVIMGKEEEDEKSDSPADVCF